MASSLHSASSLTPPITKRQNQQGFAQLPYPTNMSEASSLANDETGEYLLSAGCASIGRVPVTYPTIATCKDLYNDAIPFSWTSEASNNLTTSLESLVIAREQTASMFPQETTEDRDLPPHKAQVYYCWSHGCNGRSFSSLTNYRRHIREKSGMYSRAICPQCGQQFVRVNARDQHVAKQRCKKIEVDENGVIRRVPMFRKTPCD